MHDRRRFIRYCLLGAGGCMLGLGRSAARTFWMRDGEGPGRWSKEAMFYGTTAGGVECRQCPNGCVLGPGETGRCKSRVEHEGKLYSIAYGNPCAVHIDPIEKKPFFHFLPSTRAYSIAAAGCNFACLNCQNWQISQVSPRETDNYDLMPSDVVEQCARNKCESIAYTYAEPTTFYEYAFDTAQRARAEKIHNVWKSNGYIREEPLRRLCPYLDAANIDLKGYDDDVYLRLNGGRLAPVLATLRTLKEEHVWLEITNLVIPGWTDDGEKVKRMCAWLVENGLRDSPMHFSRFVPLYKLAHLPSTPIATLEKVRSIALEAGVRYVYIGNVPGHDGENTYCHHCRRMIIGRRGFTIVEKHMGDGHCAYCGTAIPGVWT
jgi:pyruvate formate lyase activating enzyme